MKKKQRINAEFALRDYIAAGNITRIKPSLSFVEKEHSFPGGRIDILAEESNGGAVLPVGLELKASNYNTKVVCVQALNYLNYLAPEKGKVFFVAPKVKMGVYTTLKSFYEKGLLELYEFSAFQDRKILEFFFTEVKPGDLDDSRKVYPLDCLLKSHPEQINWSGAREESITIRFLGLFPGKGKTAVFAKSVRAYTEKKDLGSLASMAEKGLDLALHYKRGKERKKIELLRDIARIYKKL